MQCARILSRKPGPRTRLSQDWMPAEKTTLTLQCLLKGKRGQTEIPPVYEDIPLEKTPHSTERQ
ncbi:hypothetical protein GBAR_LOCUS24890 [Geodia barretti]|uniref:Uncharacterized protein n=1 Tax=Geodia barretti TaxID=519541 RepID=A0AA35TBL5_GEOBA|nr:hypothetical protein GBAR_LOCUS24890 [Geodia barretti]